MRHCRLKCCVSLFIHAHISAFYVKEERKEDFMGCMKKSVNFIKKSIGG